MAELGSEPQEGASWIYMLQGTDDLFNEIVNFNGKLSYTVKKCQKIGRKRNSNNYSYHTYKFAALRHRNFDSARQSDAPQLPWYQSALRRTLRTTESVAHSTNPTHIFRVIQY